MCSSSFVPFVPKAKEPDPPPAPAPAPQVEDTEVQEDRRKDLARRQLAVGRGTTILTGAQGALQPANTNRTVILGRTAA